MALDFELEERGSAQALFSASPELDRAGVGRDEADIGPEEFAAIEQALIALERQMDSGSAGGPLLTGAATPPIARPADGWPDGPQFNVGDLWPESR